MPLQKRVCVWSMFIVISFFFKETVTAPASYKKIPNYHQQPLSSKDTVKKQAKSCRSASAGKKPKKLPEKTYYAEVTRKAATAAQFHKNALALGKKIVEYTNKFRAKQGLPAVSWSDALAHQAYGHSLRMGTNVVPFGHDGFSQRVNNLNQRVRAASENVFMCHNMQGDLAQLAVDSWIKSPGHLRNLVGPYSHCGIGAYQNAQGAWYFTQFFATF